MCDLETSSSARMRKEAGYTLAELAICLCIIGLLMGGGMSGASRFFEAQKNAETRRNLNLVANVLSSYTQTHYRLPCPADQTGREKDGGKCATGEPAGAVPWKELAIPHSMAVDGWGREIIYSPAPGLTIDTQASSAAVVNNACRSALGYDANGNHLNRAKALFCCGAPPADTVGEMDMAATAAAANAIEPASGGSADSRQGSFSIPHYMDGPAAPLPNPAVPAVTLSAGGIVLSLRSDQLFARAGSGSCASHSSAVTRPYACMSQNFRSGGGAGEVKDPDTGKMVPVPPLYGVDLALTGSKYRLRAALTNSSGESAYDDSLGFYVIRSDGGIADVQMPVPSVRKWSAGETVHFTVAPDRDVIGIGFFVVPDGYKQTDDYKHADLSRLKFISGVFGSHGRRASIADQVPPVLVSVDPATGAEITIKGAGGVNAYHLYSNLNPGHASHTLRANGICKMEGEKVGPNHDLTCEHPTAITEAGINPARPAVEQIGFEDSTDIRCYEARDGNCRGVGNQAGKDLLSDGEGGYIASIGDNSYDDVAFSIAMTACPEKP